MPVSGQGRFSRPCGICNGITHPCVPDILDGGGNIADIAGLQGIARSVSGGEVADFHNVKFAAGGHQAHFHPGTDRAFLHPDEADGTAVVVIERVKNQCLKRGGGIAVRRRNMLYDSLQNVFDIQTGLG